MSTQRQHTVRIESNSKSVFHCLSFVRYARCLHDKCARCVLSLYVVHWECQVYSLIYSARSIFCRLFKTFHIYTDKKMEKRMANN